MFNKKLRQIFYFVFVVSIFTSCASINSVSLTAVPSQRGKVVRAQASKWIFLGLSFDNDFIDNIVPDLQRQCPGGIVNGLLTKDESISYFIVYNHKVTSTGFCNSSIAKAEVLPGPMVATDNVESR